MFSTTNPGRAVESYYSAGKMRQEGLLNESLRRQYRIAVRAGSRRYRYSLWVARFGLWMQRFGERLQAPHAEPPTVARPADSEARFVYR